MGWAVNAKPGRFTPGTNRRGGPVGPRAGLQGCGKSRPHRDSILGPSSPQRVFIPTVMLCTTALSGHKRNEIILLLLLLLLLLLDNPR
jgi:hypothetical protein